MTGNRTGWTEGQRYTLVIGLGLAVVLLAFGLPASLRSPAPSAAASVSSPPPTLATVVAPNPPPTRAGPSVLSAVPPSTPRALAPPSAPPTIGPSDAPPTGTLPRPADPPAEAACPSTSGVQPLVDALAAIDVFPDQSTTLILARVAGCSETDPVVLLLGALAEVGSGLADLGIEVPALPIPFLEIPIPIVDLVQPLRDAIDPVCDAVGSVIQVFAYAFGTWPAGVGAALGTPLRQVALACGQLRID